MLPVTSFTAFNLNLQPPKVAIILPREWNNESIRDITEQLLVIFYCKRATTAFDPDTIVFERYDRTICEDWRGVPFADLLKESKTDHFSWGLRGIKPNLTAWLSRKVQSLT